MSNLPVSFDHCVIHVSNWEIAKDFYTRVLGAEAVQSDHGYRFRWGNQQLNCHGPGLFAEPKARVPVESGNSDLCFCWNGPIAGAADHLEEQGVALEMGPVERFGGQGQGTSIYFRDPDGSLMEFISYAQ